jgi:2-oxo-4-hydroxy-4-carboxy-5-ureidoimidazoline decarboxylase
MKSRPPIAVVNALSAAEFHTRFAPVFEHAPWVAAGTAAKRPFASQAALHAAMCAVVDAAGTDEKLALVRGHPELAGKAAIDRTLTAESAGEQAGAGLDRLTPAEFARFHELNAAYRTRFGFPFIVAVRGIDKAAILAAFERRLANSPEAEFAEALAQIGRITALRLADLVEDD